MPHETDAVSAQVLCPPHNHAPCHSMQGHIHKMAACLAVTCHLHFWQNDQYLLHATAVTRGWNGYRNKSQHRKVSLEISRHSCGDLNSWPFDHESSAQTTELSHSGSYPAQGVIQLRYATSQPASVFHWWRAAARGFTLKSLNSSPKKVLFCIISDSMTKWSTQFKALTHLGHFQANLCLNGSVPL